MLRILITTVLVVMLGCTPDNTNKKTIDPDLVKIDTVKIYLRDTLYRDTVQVKMSISNIFYVVVPDMDNGKGWGRNIPRYNKSDTVFWIRYPNDRDYKIIKRDSLRLKFKNLNI